MITFWCPNWVRYESRNKAQVIPCCPQECSGPQCKSGQKPKSLISPCSVALTARCPTALSPHLPSEGQTLAWLTGCQHEAH